MSFCTNCGKELTENAKFCANCGSSINATPTPQPSENQRKQVYDGVIHKCPSCGETWNSFSLTCPSCGYELRDGKVTNTLTEFTKKMEELENKRNPERSFISSFKKKFSTDTIDQQKIALIQNFPIPNTREDILEFMIFASSNIDSNQYNSLNSAIQNSATNKALSNAWISKLEQTYQKAIFSFGNHPDFEKIKTLYEKKKKELRFQKLKWLFIVAPIILFYLIFFLFIIPNS